MGKPPPFFRAMPERKRVFTNDLFPYCDNFLTTLIYALALPEKDFQKLWAELNC